MTGQRGSKKLPASSADVKKALEILGQTGLTTDDEIRQYLVEKEQLQSSLLASTEVKKKIIETPTKEFLSHLKSREGSRNKVYLDSLGKPTVGIGHLLTNEERKKYKVGDIVPQNILDNWLEQDSNKAWEAALTQAKELGINDIKFIESLASVNFQLGINWFKEHKKTWSYLKQKDYSNAADEAANSTWFKQTPVRVKDFQKAILQLIN